MNNCNICDDFVSEYGNPVCMGCYHIMRRRIEQHVATIEKLEKERDHLLAEFSRAQQKLKTKMDRENR